MNTKLEAHPVTGELGPAQKAALDGPDGPPIRQFVCTACERKFFDMPHYFYGVESTRCLWCNKYGRVAKKATKEVAKKATKEMVDPKD